VVVASPGYLARHPRPRAPADLQDHNCFRQRLGGGVVHRWSFEKRGKSVEVAVTGSLIGESDLTIRAALDGIGIARVPATFVESHIEGGRLTPLLEDWMPQSVGFFLYYPSRRQMTAALQAFIDVLKPRRSGSSGRGETKVHTAKEG
jgi:DNA-binding transcriptional LysR family regulator